MSQLEQLQKLQVKTQEFKIPRNPKEGEEQATVKFTALALDDLKLLSFDEGSPQGEVMDGLYLALSKSLSSKEEPVSVEVVENLSATHMKDLMDILMEVNNFDEADKEKLSKVKDMIAKKNGQFDKKSEE